MSYFFQVQTVAPQGNLGDVQLLASVHTVLPAVQTSLWRSGADAETTAPGLDVTVAPTISVPVPASVSVLAPVEVETQARAQIPTVIPALKQTPVLVSAQAASMPQTPSSTHSKAPSSVPIRLPIAVPVSASVPGQSPVSAPSPTFDLPNALSKSSDTSSVTGKPQFSVPGLVSAPVRVTLPASVQAVAPSPAPVPVAPSIPAPVLQPAGIQTAVSVPEHASLATTQQNLETTSAASTLQQEPCVEVGMKPNVSTFWIKMFLHLLHLIVT